MVEFQWNLPCDPTDLVYFRDRIGAEGVHLILSVTANMHDSCSEDMEDLMIYWCVLLQKRTDKNKIYSLHEPQVYCLAKE